MITSDALQQRLRQTRQQTLNLCKSLAYDDYLVQSAEFVSPPKWHLAHTTWFFETFCLIPFLSGYREFSPDFSFLFNSYYKAIGKHSPRLNRGNISRPTLDEVRKYREYVDSALSQTWATPSSEHRNRILELGIEHEKQHQELLLMDIKHIYFQNPNPPTLWAISERSPSESHSLSFIDFPGGIVNIGHTDQTFCFDNELPAHQVLQKPFSVANRPVTNGEFLEFIAEGGYRNSSLWLSDGWDLVQRDNWTAPLYWFEDASGWREFTLYGVSNLAPNEPVCHVSGFEADAYARWRGARLPTEFEWESAFKHNTEQLQLSGRVWEWTSSAYLPYPGFRPLSGAIGEYNGKFMSNQWVLKGGASITPPDHIRKTYRNFFHPHMRWQFSGIRLAMDSK